MATDSESDPIADIRAQIDTLSSSQRRELINGLLKAYDERVANPDPDLQAKRRRNLDELLRRMRELPIESPNDGFSGADHDRILYGDGE